MVRRQAQSAVFLVIGLIAWGGAQAQEASPLVSLTVQVDQPTHPISPLLYGIFLEDINFGVDGGLNAELVKNGSFEFPHKLMGWKPAAGTERRACRVINDAPRRASNPNFLRLTAAGADASSGATNEGFRGMGVREGERYDFNAWARSEAGKPVRLTARLVDSDGGTLAETQIDVNSSEWHDVSAVLEPQRTDAKASLELSIAGPGLIDLDMVSLCPEKTWKDRPHGLRADLVQLLADLKPAFFRFPGGCIVEGSQLKYRYQWKTTIGDLADRRLLLNRWNNEFRHRLTPDYFQSFAVGFYEYFLLSEEIGAEPLPILNCGMACQFNSSELVPLEELGPYIQDALDLVEFANGPVTSTWGAKRAALGHPEPFHLKLLGIGNEQWDQQYIDRYKEFSRVLKERHPEIQLVSGSGPFPSDEHFKFAWPQLRALDADIIDEHCYAMPDWFLKSAQRYDGYDRNGPKVFMGEYSAQSVDITSPNNRNNLLCALAEAAFMTGLERNSDVVVMSSYAPLFGHEQAWQWRPNLIWFDNLLAYATPNYYVQQLFSQHRGDTVLPVELVDSHPAEQPQGRIGLATSRSSAEFKDLVVTRNGETLFTGDTIESPSDTTAFHGNWRIRDGVFRQSDPRGDGRLLFGDHGWSEYTLSLKARKLRGQNGFIVIFRNSRGGSFLEWIVGDRNNQQHGIHAHLASHSTDTNIAAQTTGSIEEDRWYDVRVELEGANVKCFLDDQLVHSLEIAPPNLARLYATASREDQSGDLILKVVNVDDEQTPTRLRLSGDPQASWQGKAIVLTGSPEDENSLSEPQKIHPKPGPAETFSTEQSYTFPAHSLTVLRLSKSE